MLKPWQVIADLESDNSRLAKEAVIAREVGAGNNEFFRGARAALDSMITFGIRQVPEKTDSRPCRGLTAERFWTTAQSLADRELTGNAAITAVNLMKNDCDAEQWNSWYRRILIKDLRCGVSEKTINSVIGKTNDNYRIPVFSCQLAHDGANHESKITGKKIVEVKLDGVRVVAIVYPSGTVNLYSRNGKELSNFPLIEQQLSKHAIFFGEPMVLDGEVMSSSFQDLMRQVHRKSDVQSEDAVLHLFDILPLREFQAGVSTAGQAQRTFQLVSWYTPIADHMPNVAVVGHASVDLDTDQGRAEFNRINQQAIDGGYEGIMIKDPEAVYETKRTHAWLKRKPFIEVSLVVVGLEEGTGKNVGRLGALICEGEDGGKKIRTNVGSGLTDDLRSDIWADQRTVLGQVVEVRADATTRSQDSDDTWSLRFPRFLRFRGFEKGEKI
jgi:DNA ligase-1